VERVDDWDGRDGRADRSHAFVKLVLGFVGADDGPCSTIVDHLLVGFFRARSSLSNTKQRTQIISGMIIRGLVNDDKDLPGTE